MPAAGLASHPRHFTNEFKSSNSSPVLCSEPRTTLDFQERGLDGAGRDVDEYKCASARTFRYILMNCTLLLTLTDLRQRLPDPLPEPPRDQRDLCCVY